MAKKQFNLETELTAKIDDLTSKLNQANNKINNFKNQAAKGNADIFSGLGKSLLGVLPALATAGAAMEVFKGVINTTQTAGDSWAITVATAKGALEGFYRTLGTGDWSNFFDNIIRGSAAAKQLAKDLDELFEKNLSLDLNLSDIDLKIAQLTLDRRIAEQNGNNKRVIEIGLEIKELEQSKLKKRQKVAEDTYNAFMDDIKTVTKLTESQVLSFLKNYNDANSEALRKEVEKYTNLLNEVKADEEAFAKYGNDNAATKFFIDKKKLQLESYSDEVKIYYATMEKYNKLNDDKIKSAVKAAIAINSVQEESIKSQMKNEVAIARSTGKEIKSVLTNLSPVVTIDFYWDKEKLQQDIQDSMQMVDMPVDDSNLTFQYFGLPALEKRLQELLEAQKNSGSSEQFAAYKLQIDEVTEKIQIFKGEVGTTNDEVSTFYSSMATTFTSLADSADRFGQKGVAAFMNVISAILETLSNLELLADMFKSFTASKELSNAINSIFSAGFTNSIKDQLNLIDELGNKVSDYMTNVSTKDVSFIKNDVSLLEEQLKLANDYKDLVIGAYGADSDQAVKAVQDVMDITSKLALQKHTLAAAEIAQAPAQIAANQAVATSEAVKSSAGVPFPGNLLAIATSVAAIIAAFASIKRFETGGIIGGSSLTGDNLLIRANSGEMILNHSQQSRLFSMLNGTASTGSGQVTFRIDGKELVGVLTNYGKFNKLTR